jgi:SAM-dependent methyltransferase
MKIGIGNSDMIKELGGFIDSKRWKKEFPHELWPKGDIALKWGGLLFNILEVIKPEHRLLEAGCGNAPLASILGGSCSSVVGVDNSRAPSFKRDNVSYILNDCLSYMESQPDQSFDIIYDSCSVTHFNCGSNETCPNKGFCKFVYESHRLLKPGGFLFVVSDCSIVPVTEFFSPDSMVKIMLDNKFNVLGGDFQKNPNTFGDKIRAGGSKIFYHAFGLNVVSLAAVK